VERRNLHLFHQAVVVELVVLELLVLLDNQDLEVLD
jgi:hypothetical protein